MKLIEIQGELWRPDQIARMFTVVCSLYVFRQGVKHGAQYDFETAEEAEAEMQRIRALIEAEEK